MTPGAGGRRRGPHLLEVRNLRTFFALRGGLFGRVRGQVRAVDGVSFHLDAGETLGLVGDSGCGKTTVGRTVLRLVEARSGEVRFEGRSLLDCPRREMKRRRRQMQIIFQDPAGSMNPRMPVGAIVGEPLLVHRLARGAALRAKVKDALERCGLRPEIAGRYPHEFSGGQRQRIAIARALALRPRLVICDEPTSALDVSVQAQILNLLQDLQAQFGLAYLFISHDMAVIHHLCDRVAVMHRGRIVETGDRDRIVHHPRHPVTRRLIAAVPGLDPRRAVS